MSKKLQRININMPVELLEKVEKLAEENYMDRTSMIVQMCNYYIMSNNSDILHLICFEKKVRFIMTKKLQRININMPIELLERVEKLASDNYMDRTSMIVQMCNYYIKSNNLDILPFVD